MYVPVGVELGQLIQAATLTGAVPLGSAVMMALAAGVERKPPPNVRALFAAPKRSAAKVRPVVVLAGELSEAKPSSWSPEK